MCQIRKIIYENSITVLGVGLVAGLLVFLITIGVLLGKSESAKLTQRETEQVQHTLDELRTSLASRVYANIYKVSAVKALVAMNPDLTQDDFARAMEVQFRGDHDLRNIGLARKMVIQFMYPIEGNEAAIGLDYTTVPDQLAAVHLAREVNQIVLAGPVTLVQGGEGLVARIPILVPDATSAREHFWGFASVVMDIDSVIAGAGIHDDHHAVRVAIRGRDARGAGGDLFWGDSLVFESAPVLQTIELPHGSWQIGAIPAAGWSSYPLFSSPLVLAHTAFSAAVLAFAGIIVVLLHTMRKKDDARAILSNSLEVILNQTSDFIYFKDANSRFVFCSRTLAEITGHGSWKEMIGKHDFEVFPHDTATIYNEEEKPVFAEGKPLLNKVDPYYTANGEIGYVQTNKWPVFDGNNAVNGIFGISRDITEHRKIVEALERERNLFAAGPVFTIEWDPKPYGEWTVRHASSNVETILGYTPAEMMHRGFSYNSLIDPEDLEHILAELKRNISTHHDSFEQSYRLLRKAGDYIWCRDFTVLVRDHHGDLTAIRSYIYDQTAYKEAEAALRVAEERLEKTAYDLTENIPVGTYTMIQPSQGGMAHFAFMSRRFLELTGLTREEAAQDPLKAFACVHPEDFDEWVAQNARAFEERAPFFGETRVVVNGEVRWVTAESKPRSLPDGTTVWEGVLADITDRKRAEEALNESLQRFNDLVSHVSVGVYIFWHRADGRSYFEYVSDNWCAMNQLSREAVLADQEIASTIFHPDDLPGFLARNEESIRERKRFVWEGRTVTGGQESFILIESTPVFFENGDSRWFGIQQDITEGKSLKEQIIREKERAEAASIAKSRFLANMSHEIRTPLNGVIGFTDLLRSTPLSPLQKQYVENANVSGHTLLGIINDILDFSKIEAGMMQLEVIRTDMIELLENCVDIISYAAGEKQLEVLLDLDPSMPRFALVDPVRLKQILTNLLSNAVKFTENGEVELNVRYTPGEPDSDRGTFFFSVRDTGIGINRKERDKLFKAFSQADNSTTRKFGGTGLGLIISQMIAEQMGSSIDLESSPGEGTIFSFDLTTTVENGDAGNNGPIASIKRCLIVDDNARNRSILERMVLRWDIESVSADNGLDALRQIESNGPFDVVICDFQMPYLDGLEVIRKIRQSKEPREAKRSVILLHSSSENTDFYRECQEAGVQFRLSKPVKSSDLHTHLRNVGQTGHEPHHKIQAPAENEKLTGNFRILIAEDVELNMLLAVSLLRKILPEAEVAKATNGIETVEQYRQQKPDLVLMDVHMPDLDGLEATAQIREIEAATGNRVPIIALTAGVMKEERDRCIAAGMDEFLTKPIESDKLRSVLSTWFAERDRAESGPAGDPGPAGEPGPAGDENPHFGYARLSDASNGNREIIQEMIAMALTDIPARVEQLTQSLQTQETGGAVRAAHSLKGIAGTMRLGPLGAIAEEIERAAREGRHGALPALMADLNAEWSAAETALRTYTTG